ncbi:hypothetical protein D3C78_1422340 [compost metagenome]
MEYNLEHQADGFLRKVTDHKIRPDVLSLTDIQCDLPLGYRAGRTFQRQGHGQLRATQWQHVLDTDNPFRDTGRFKCAHNQPAHHIHGQISLG